MPATAAVHRTETQGQGHGERESCNFIKKIISLRRKRWGKVWLVLALLAAVLVNVYLLQLLLPSSSNISQTRTFPHTHYKSQPYPSDDDDSVFDSDLVSSVKRNTKEQKRNAGDKTVLRLNELDFVPECEIKSKDAISAIHRAKTQQCKKKIVNVVCAIQENQFYKTRLRSGCPGEDIVSGNPLGCFRDEKNQRLLSGYYSNHKDTNNPEFCIDLCLQGGFPFAGVQYATECFCGENSPPSTSKLADTSCNMKCPGNSKELCGGYFTMNVFQTGIEKFNAQIAAVATQQSSASVRIVFLLTLNGRALRQVRRLINVLYDPKHFFYIHVDARQDYLYRELLHVEKLHSNIRLSRKRYATIWGGASLLEMLLNSMNELLMMDWKWDFVINLSESDFPIKPIEKLEEFLSANKGKNFVKSHGREVQRFIQKQGLDKTFVECDAHMWRVGDRTLPWGIQIDGGSDWIALDKSFVSYVAGNQDSLVSGLLTVFRHTLLPAESFFHTVLRNSKFCHSYIDNNLHVTNWKRKLGCKCQYKHVVDWCGCSPNDFKVEDWPRLQATESRQLFFARKFEPIINQAIILRVEQWIKGPDQDNMINLDAYWQSIYHYADLSPPPDDALITIATSLARQNSKILLRERCHSKSGFLREISSYHFADVYKGNLILHNAEIENIGAVTIETWYKYQHSLQINKSSKLFERLKILTVSSDYDQKEQTFRNLGRSLGPFSEPSLMYHFVPGVENPLSTSNVTFLWLDSIGNIADINDVFIDDGNIINFVKPNFKAPLIPGIWTVKMIEQNNLVAQTEFLVTPLEFMSGSPISQQEIPIVHSGTVIYKDFSNNIDKVRKFIPSDSEKRILQSKADSNANRFDLDLLEWIDGLIPQFYSILGTCIVSKDIESIQCGNVLLMACHSTSWSTLAPDPKSFQKRTSNYVNLDTYNFK